MWFNLSSRCPEAHFLMLAAANIEHYSFLTSNGGLSVGKQKEKKLLRLSIHDFQHILKKELDSWHNFEKTRRKVKCNCFSPDATIKNKFRFYEFSN